METLFLVLLFIVAAPVALFVGLGLVVLLVASIRMVLD